MVLQNGILKTGLLTDLAGLPQQASALQVATAVPVTAGMVATTDVLGRVIPANANLITTQRVVGLCDKTVGAGVGVGIAGDFLHLQDWTPIVGTAQLIPNTEYFLSDTVSGALTATPPTTPGSYVLRVGIAVNEETLSISIGVPIKLF